MDATLPKGSLKHCICSSHHIVTYARAPTAWSHINIDLTLSEAAALRWKPDLISECVSVNVNVDLIYACYETIKELRKKNTAFRLCFLWSGKLVIRHITNLITNSRTVERTAEDACPGVFRHDTLHPIKRITLQFGSTVKLAVVWWEQCPWTANNTGKK